MAEDNKREEKSPLPKPEEYFKSRQMRVTPLSDLDFQLLTTNTEWGSAYIPEELRKKLSEEILYKDENGQVKISREHHWDLMGFYTRDMRLSNLDNNEIIYCEHYLNLANDFLRCDFVKPFLIALSRAASKLELAQSKKGFLRKRMNTLTHEQYKEEVVPKKKNNFLGFNKSEAPRV